MKNNALSLLEPLVGEWEYTMFNCWFLESMNTTVKGFTTIEILHDSFIVIRNRDADHKPDDIWVIGYSDPQEKYELFYFDQRGVARIFNMTFAGSTMVFWREDKDFYQRVTFEIKADKLHSVAEASEDKGNMWKKDLEMAYVRSGNQKSKEHETTTSAASDVLDTGPFYHGTKADLQVGDLLTAGFKSNYYQEVTMNHIYFTALVNGAGLAAELAPGDGPARIYIVEPAGDFENDPNVTDKKFPGNPTRSYRSKESLKIVGEVKEWSKLTTGELKKWKEDLAKLKANPNAEIIN